MARNKNKKARASKTRARQQRRLQDRAKKRGKEADDLLDGLTDRQKDQVFRRLQRVKERRSQVVFQPEDQLMDPRDVALPEANDSLDSQGSEFESDEDISTLVARHKRERKNLNRLYTEVKNTTLKKGDIYEDECGRTTVKGDDISIGSSTANSNPILPGKSSISTSSSDTSSSSDSLSVDS